MHQVQPAGAEHRLAGLDPAIRRIGMDAGDGGVAIAADMRHAFPPLRHYIPLRSRRHSDEVLCRGLAHLVFVGEVLAADGLGCRNEPAIGNRKCPLQIEIDEIRCCDKLDAHVGDDVFPNL